MPQGDGQDEIIGKMVEHTVFTDDIYLVYIGTVISQVRPNSMFWVFRKKHGWVTLLFLLTVVFTIGSLAYF